MGEDGDRRRGPGGQAFVGGLLGDNGAAAEAAGEATRKRAASLGLTL